MSETSKTPNLIQFLELLYESKQMSVARGALLLKHVDEDLAAIEARHAEEVSSLHERNADLRERLSDANEELASLRAKMAGMVCGTCKGEEVVLATPTGSEPNECADAHHEPCPVCQPKENPTP